MHWNRKPFSRNFHQNHNNDLIMSAMVPQITSLTIVYSTVYSRHRSKKTSKLHVTGLCEGNSSVTGEWNSPVTGEFPAQSGSNAENVSIWWRHHVATSPFQCCAARCECLHLTFFDNSEIFIHAWKKSFYLKQLWRKITNYWLTISLWSVNNTNEMIITTPTQNLFNDVFYKGFMSS